MEILGFLFAFLSGVFLVGWMLHEAVKAYDCINGEWIERED